MVYGIIARGLSKAIGTYGPPAVVRLGKTFKRYDVKIHRQLYGKSGGAGVRHGRDAGSIIAGLYQGTRSSGDELDAPTFVPPTSGKKLQTRSGRSNKRRSGRTKSGTRCYCNGQSKFSRYRRR